MRPAPPSTAPRRVGVTMLALYDAVLAALAADPATRQDALSSMTVIGRASGASAARSRANGVGAEWPG